MVPVSCGGAFWSWAIKNRPNVGLRSHVWEQIRPVYCRASCLAVTSNQQAFPVWLCTTELELAHCLGACKMAVSGWAPSLAISEETIGLGLLEGLSLLKETQLHEAPTFFGPCAFSALYCLRICSRRLVSLYSRAISRLGGISLNARIMQTSRCRSLF